MSDRLLSLVADSRPSAERAPVGAAFRELDRVRILAEVVGEEGVRVPAGSTGTVVAVWGGGPRSTWSSPGPSRCWPRSRRRDW